MEARRGVVQPAVRPQGLDQLVLALGGDDPSDEEEIGPTPFLGGGEFRRHPAIGWGAHPPVVHQDRDHRGPTVTGPPEVPLVEAAVGQSQLRPVRQ